MLSVIIFKLLEDLYLNNQIYVYKIIVISLLFKASTILSFKALPYLVREIFV